jgi:hypothetical protein
MIACGENFLNYYGELMPYNEVYYFDLILCEQYILMLFDYYISILNFNDNNLTQNIFNYFSEAIMDVQKTNQLNPNEYSFHYTLYRGFSIFVVRYIFHYINANNIDDIYEGIKNVTKIMPDFKKIGEIIINDYFKLFGFMIACGENFLNYYGELMPYNEVYYFDYKDYILTDFALIKIFFSINDYQSYFSLLNIYKKSSLEGTYKIMKKHFFSNDITRRKKIF